MVARRQPIPAAAEVEVVPAKEEVVQSQPDTPDTPSEALDDKIEAVPADDADVGRGVCSAKFSRACGAHSENAYA